MLGHQGSAFFGLSTLRFKQQSTDAHITSEFTPENPEPS